jgi:YVTN family beta-propeller protein
VSVIDPATRKVKHTTKVGTSAGAIVVNSGANQAYLVRSLNWLTVLDTETYAVTANIAVGKHPSSVAFDGAFVYVTNFESNTLCVVDPRPGESHGQSRSAARRSTSRWIRSAVIST